MRSKRDASCANPYVVVFDIGATSVGVGLSECGPQGTRLLWFARLEYSYDAYDDYERYERTMYSTLLELGMKLSSEGFPFVRAEDPAFRTDNLTVHCVLAPPWFFAGVARSVVSREKPFTTDQELLKKLHHDGLAQVTETQLCHAWQEVMGEYEVLEQEEQTTYLAGYPVVDWEHRTVREVALVAYYALIGTAVAAHVREILARVLPHTSAILVSSTRLLNALYHQTLWSGQTAQATLVEVLGQVTSIATMRKGSLTHVRTIPLGTNHILRAAAPNAVSIREAQSKLEVVRKTREGSEGNTMTLPEEVNVALNDWYHAVRDEIIAQSGGVTPPELTLVMVGMNWYEFLFPLLEQPYLVPGIREEHPFIVRACSEFVLPIHGGSDVPKDAILDSRIQVFTDALRHTLAL